MNASDKKMEATTTTIFGLGAHKSTPMQSVIDANSTDITPPTLVEFVAA